MVHIPGVPVLHAVITPRCRVVQGGDVEAFDEAARRIRERYRQHIEMADPDVLDRQNLRLVLLAETAEEDPS